MRVVGDDDRRHPPLACLVDHLHNGLGVRRVEGARGFVGEKQVALSDDRAGDGDPLALATGELIGKVTRPIADVDLLQRGHPRRPRLFQRNTVEL